MAKMTEQMKQELKAEKAYNKKHKKMYKLTANDIIFNIINYTIFALIAFICIFPFYYLFINTVSDASEVSSNSITFYIKGFTLKNYAEMLKLDQIWTSLWVTFSRTIIATALMVIATGIIGYLFTKQEMWKRKFWYRMFVVTMYFNAGIVPWYSNMYMLSLTSNYLAYILPAIVAPYNIILVKTYIESIPAELEESAFLDGAGYATIFRKIIWPLSKPILATVTIFGAVGNWNSFQDSLILNGENNKLWTLQHTLWSYLQHASNAGKNVSIGDGDNIAQAAENAKIIRYTISMVTIIPILIVYPFLMRYFQEGIMLGAVKG